MKRGTCFGRFPGPKGTWRSAGPCPSGADHGQSALSLEVPTCEVFELAKHLQMAPLSARGLSQDCRGVSLGSGVACTDEGIHKVDVRPCDTGKDCSCVSVVPFGRGAHIPQDAVMIA